MIYKFNNLAKQSFFKEARLCFQISNNPEPTQEAPTATADDLYALNSLAEIIYNYNGSQRLNTTDEDQFTDSYNRRVNTNEARITDIESLKTYINQFGLHPDTANTIAQFIWSNLDSQGKQITTIQFNDSTKNFNVSFANEAPQELSLYQLIGESVSTNIRQWQVEATAVREETEAALDQLMEELPSDQSAETTEPDTPNAPQETTGNAPETATTETTSQPDPSPEQVEEIPDVLRSQITSITLDQSVNLLISNNLPAGFDINNQGHLLILAAIVCDAYDESPQDLIAQGYATLSSDNSNLILTQLGDNRANLINAIESTPELFNSQPTNLQEATDNLEANPYYNTYQLRLNQNRPETTEREQTPSTSSPERQAVLTATRNSLTETVNNIEDYEELEIPNFVRQRNMQQADFRRLFIQQEINNAGQIQTCLTNLGFSINEFAGLFHDGINRRIDDQPINTQSFLRFTDYADESFDIFCANLQLLIDSESTLTTPELRQELSERTQIFINIKTLIDLIRAADTETLDSQRQPSVIDPDYVSDVNMPQDYFERLNPEDRGRFNQDSRRDAMTLVAIMCELYGATPNDLIQRGILSVDSESLGQPFRTPTGVPIGLTLNIIDLGPKEAELISIVGRNRNIFSHNGSAQNLSEIMYRLTEHNDYPQLRQHISESLTSDPLQLLLNQVANGNTTGSFIRRNRLINDRIERLDNPDINGRESSLQDMNQRRAINNQNRDRIDIYRANATGAENSDIMSQQFSEAAFRNYLVTHISKYENGQLTYDQEELTNFLSRMIVLGKQALITNVNLTDEERTQLQEAANDITPGTPLTQDQIELVRLGFVTEMNSTNLTMRAIPTETAEDNDSDIPSGMDSLITDAIPETAHPATTSRQIIKALGGLRAEDFRNINPNDLRLGFGTEVVLMQNRETGELRARFSAGTQTNEAGTTSIDGFFPMMNFMLQYDPNDSDFSVNGGISIGVGTVAASIGGGYTFANKSEIAASIGAGMFNFVPGLLANVYYGTSYEQNIENAQERLAEGHLENLTDIQTIRDIASNQVSRDVILQYANNEPDLFAAINSNETYTPAEKENLKVTLLTELCQQIILAGVDNARGVAFGIGLSMFFVGGVIPLPPVPTVRFEWGGQTRTHYSMGSSYNQDLQMLGNYIMSRAPEAQTSETPTPYVISVTTNSGDITIDGSTGEFEITRGASPEIDIPEDDTTEEQATTNTLQQLNSVENTTGLHFESVEGNPNYKYVFSIDDFNTGGESLTPTQVINLYSDPQSGIQLHITSDNKIGISFANGEHEIPRTFHMTRTQVHNPVGELVGATSICFSNRIANPSQVINSPLTSSYLSARPNQAPTVEQTIYANLGIEYTPTPETPLVESADLGLDPEFIQTSADLLQKVTSDLESLNIEVTPEMQAIANRLTNDLRFMTQLKEIATIQELTPQNIYPELVNLIRSSLTQEEANSTDPETMANYLQSILIPNSYINLSDRQGLEERIESINTTTERALRPFLEDFINTPPYNQYYNDQGDLVEYTEQEREEIIQTIIDSNHIDVDTLDQVTRNHIESDDFATVVQDSTLPLGTRILTAAGTRRDSEDARGLRPLILADPTTMRFLNGTQKPLAEGSLAQQFVRNLFERPFPANEFAGWSPEQRLDFFNSESVTKLISLTYNLNGQDLPVINLMYDQETINTLNEIYSDLTPDNLSSLSAEQIQSLELLILDVRGLQAGLPLNINEDADRLDTNNDSTAIIHIEPTQEMGTVFLENCGNLSVYQNTEYTATVTVNIPRGTPPTPGVGVVADEAQAISQMDATNSRNTVGVSFEIFARPGSRPGRRPDYKPDDEFGIPSGVI